MEKFRRIKSLGKIPARLVFPEPRGEGKLIGREYARPAVRLQVARTLAVADFFQEFEDENTGESRAGGSAYRGVAVRAANEEKNDGEAIPEPAIPDAGGRDHPITNP